MRNLLADPIEDFGEPQNPTVRSEQEEDKKIDEIRMTFFNLMDVLEEYTDERLWSPLLVSSVVFSSVLKSANPVSVHELGNFFRNYRIISETDLQNFLSEVKYL